MVTTSPELPPDHARGSPFARTTVAGSPPVMVSGEPRLTVALNLPTSGPPAPLRVYGPATRVAFTCPGMGGMPAPSKPSDNPYELRALFVTVVLFRFEPVGPVSVMLPASSNVVVTGFVSWDCEPVIWSTWQALVGVGCPSCPAPLSWKPVMREKPPPIELILTVPNCGTV